MSFIVNYAHSGFTITQMPSRAHMHTHAHAHTHTHTHTHTRAHTHTHTRTEGYRLIVQDTLSPKAKCKKVISEMQSAELSQGGERREES